MILTELSMTDRSKLPPTVYLLGLTIFSLVTAEFMVAGMMPALAEAFSVSLAQVGNLIAFYALGMALGGPPVTVLLLSRGISNKRALVGLLAVYVVAGALAAAAPSYAVLVLARILMGVSSAACIGLCMTLCAGLVAIEQRGRAISVVLAGLMLSPVAGVPMTAWVEQHHGWRASAWLVVVLALAGFALSGGQHWLSLGCFIALGFTGVALNPAMVARVMKAAEPGALVNALHTSVITAGLALGSWAGGSAIDAGYGLRAPLWVGAAMALVGLLSLVRPVMAGRMARSCA